MRPKTFEDAGQLDGQKHTFLKILPHILLNHLIWAGIKRGGGANKWALTGNIAPLVVYIRKRFRFSILRTSDFSQLRGDRGVRKNLVDIMSLDLNLEPHNKAKGEFQMFLTIF